MRLHTCARLTKLCVMSCNMPESAMADVAPQLRVLKLSDVPNASDAMLSAATGLTRLDLSRMDAIGGTCFGRMQRLRRLKLDGMDGLCSAGLASLAGLAHPMARFFGPCPLLGPV